MDVTVGEVQSVRKWSLPHCWQAKHGGHHMHATERIPCDLGFLTSQSENR